MFKILAVMLTAAFAIVALTTTIIMATAPSIESAYAQLTKDPGASGFTPKEEPQIPGWDPNLASEDAPGQIPPTFCAGCAADFSPGQEGLEAGIIGPDLKK